MWDIDWDLFIHQHPFLIHNLVAIMVFMSGYLAGRSDRPRKPKRRKGKMPVGTITNSVSDKKPLASLPEGYVIVRRMNYGEQLARTGMATRFLVGSDSAKTGASAGDAFKGELDIQTAEVALWDFANLVVEHNLTNDKEQPLNFKIPAHVQSLHPKVGEEIGRIIDEWNDAENSEDVKNS